MPGSSVASQVALRGQRWATTLVSPRDWAPRWLGRWAQTFDRYAPHSARNRAVGDPQKEKSDQGEREREETEKKVP
jgi:hypothetical protein